MLDGQKLAKRLYEGGVTCECLYRIDLEQQDVPGARPSSFLTHGRRPEWPVAWKKVGMLQDLQERTIPEIIDEIFEFLSDKNGTWRVKFFYWQGIMQKETPTRHMGKGEAFLYDDNMRGDRVATLTQTFNLNLEKM